MIPLTTPLDDQFLTMPWDAIDNVVFDVGNVLLTFDPQAVLEDVFPGQVEKHRLIQNRVFRSPCWVMLDRGVLDNREAARIMAGTSPELERDILYLMENWINLKNTISEGIDVLRRCKEMGKKCYVLSNYPREGFRHIREKYDFFQLMDGFVVSSDVLLLKPDPAIYQYLLDRFRLDGNRTLFIDDTPANIEGALHCGIQGICFHTPGKLRRFFQIEEGISGQNS